MHIVPELWKWTSSLRLEPEGTPHATPFRCGIWVGRGDTGRGRAWTGRGPPDSCFWALRFCVPSWQKGVGSWRGAELEILICDGDSQQSPHGSPSWHAKPQKALAAGLCYLITFWRLIQWSGSIVRRGRDLFGALGFAFPEEAGMDFRKNCWKGNAVTLAPAF